MLADYLVTMAMVDRYKKSGGFIQLLQVIETCGPKKREQFMKIINEETPKWGEAIQAKMLSFEKILSWKPEAVMEITAQVNPLAFGTALKSLQQEQFDTFVQKLGPQERRKFEQIYKEGTPSPNEISACLMKVINETRLLFASGTLKFDKIDPDLAIPDEFESKLEKGSGLGGSSLRSADEIASAAATSTGIQLGNPNEVDSLRRKIVELNSVITALKRDNTMMKDKLEKIKKIA